MPEAATIEAPESTQSSSGTSAISEFTSQMAATVARGNEPVKSEPKTTAEPAPVEKTETPGAAKPVETQAKPTEKPSGKEKPMAEWTQEDFDTAMKKAPSKAYKIYEYYKSKTNPELESLRSKIKDIESKRVESPGDAKKIEAYEKQIKELNEQTQSHLKTIAELDYSRSPEFKKQYTDRLAGAYQTAIEEVKQLTVQEGDVQRPATQQDFDLLMRLPLKEQIMRAKAMFGDASDAFFSHRNEIQRIQREGREALTRAQEEAEGRRTQAEVQSKEESRIYEAQLEVEHNDLVDKFPELFGDTDNKEAADAMQKGMDFARRALSERSKMSPADRAAHDAVLQATHAAFRRMTIEFKAKDAEIDNLKKELAKYRKSDPGSETTGKAPPAGSEDDIGGIEAMAAKVVKV